MERVKQFLILDGLLVAFGLLFFLRAYLKSKPENHFRDDIWKEIKDPTKREAAKLAYEDQVDKKILIGLRPEAEEKPEFLVPNFRGKPHEILGIRADASVETITRAHKHWIKKYHPDRVTHLGGAYVEQARRRAEQLNTARQQMLQGKGSKTTTKAPS